jgi:hypothetical protein
LAEINPWQKNVKTKLDTSGGVVDGEGNTLDPIAVTSKIENPSKTKSLSDIQQENTIWRKNVSWAKDYPPNATTHRENMNTVQYGTPDKLATDTTKVGEQTIIDQETPPNLEQFFQQTNPTIIDPKQDSKFKDLFQYSKGTPRTPKKHEVFQRCIEIYKQDYYIPGIDYQNWLMNNPTHANAKPLKNNQYSYFPANLFRDVNGYLVVPCLHWNGSGWNPFGLWLGNDWNRLERVALLSRPLSSTL